METGLFAHICCSRKSRKAFGHTESNESSAAFQSTQPAYIHSQQASETGCTTTSESQTRLSFGWPDQRHALRDTPKNGCRDCRWKVLFGRQMQRSWCVSFCHIDLQQYHYIGMTARGRQGLLLSTGCPLQATLLPQASPPCTSSST